MTDLKIEFSKEEIKCLKKLQDDIELKQPDKSKKMEVCESLKSQNNFDVLCYCFFGKLIFKDKLIFENTKINDILTPGKSILLDKNNCEEIEKDFKEIRDLCIKESKINRDEKIIEYKELDLEMQEKIQILINKKCFKTEIKKVGDFLQKQLEEGNWHKFKLNL